MKRCALSATLAVLGVMLAAGPALADDHPNHPPRYRVYKRKRVIVVQPPPPPRRQVVVVDREPVPEPTRSMLGIGLRISGAALDGSKINLGTFENPVMGGLGIQMRSMVSKHWGLELSVDWLQSEDEDAGFSQRTFPIMLSAMFYLFPESAINIYGLAGAGVHFTNLSYADGLFEHDILEVAGQLGVGVQVKLGDHFALHADLRFLTVYKNLGSATEIANECISSRAGRTGFCSGLQNVDTEDKFNLGAQFQAGATYFF
jgi:hypothetical protein